MDKVGLVHHVLGDGVQVGVEALRELVLAQVVEPEAGFKESDDDWSNIRSLCSIIEEFHFRS